MNAADFANACRRDRDSLLMSYDDGNTYVSTILASANLDPEQKELVSKALRQAVTDAYYGLLLALDGSAALGGEQQSFRIIDEAGNTVSHGNGDLEAAAWNALQES